jgi:transposase
MCRITGLSLEQLRVMQAALQGKTVMKEDFIITDNREYGASFVGVSLIKQLGLHTDIFSRPAEKWVKATLAMIVGRLIYAGSKLSLSHCGSYSALWEICGINEKIDVDDHCYEPMDRLLERQDAIQKKLAARHLSGGTLVLYDITSCYMEGEYADSDLVNYGYSRDKKRGHEQIIISLLCTKDGCPVAVEVFKGNTKDETTVMDKIEEIQKKYELDKIVFVGDRGMVTQAKYKEINHDLIKVISALTHDKIQELSNNKIIQLGMFDEKDIVEVIDGDIRYCLCKNPDMAIKETATRNNLLQKTTEELDKIVACKRKTKYSKEVRIGRVIGKYKMGKFILLDGKGEDVNYKLDHAKIEQEARLDGCYVVFTDVPQKDMSAVEAVANYKNLLHVEQAFRNLKTVRLEIRPIYHKTDDRIKCHVFICMLAYYVMWHMNQRLKPLFATDGIGPDRKYTFDYVIETLKRISIQNVEVCGSKSSIISTPTNEQAKIMEHLKVKI